MFSLLSLALCFLPQSLPPNVQLPIAVPHPQPPPGFVFLSSPLSLTTPALQEHALSFRSLIRTRLCPVQLTVPVGLKGTCDNNA